ncbi:MAG: hypothetical protein ACR5K7_02995 [Symbiopectobacterium sp.]
MPFNPVTSSAGQLISWRPAFGLLIVLSAVIFFLSFRMKADKGKTPFWRWK